MPHLSLFYFKYRWSKMKPGVRADYPDLPFGRYCRPSLSNSTNYFNFGNR